MRSHKITITTGSIPVTEANNKIMKVEKLTPIFRARLKLYGDKISAIHNVACKVYGISLKDSRSKSQALDVCHSRHMTFLISRQLLGVGCPYHIIGYVVGGNGTPIDHTTVRAAAIHLEKLLDSHDALGRYYNTDLRLEDAMIYNQCIPVIANMDVANNDNTESVHIYLSKELKGKLAAHCKTIHIKQGAFIRVCLMELFNKGQYELHL